MAIYLESNEQGGGGLKYIQDDSSDQGIFIGEYDPVSISSPSINKNTIVIGNSNLSTELLNTPNTVASRLDIRDSLLEYSLFKTSNSAITEPNAYYTAVTQTVDSESIEYNHRVIKNIDGQPKQAVVSAQYTNDYVDSNNIRIAHTVSVDSKEASIRIETDDSSSQPEILFTQSNLNSGESIKLSDFALKSDISSGVDLTNYEGDWNLTKQVSAGNVTVSLQSLSYFQPDISAGTLFNTEPLKTYTSIASGSFAEWFNNGDILKGFSGTGYGSSAIQAVEYQEQKGGTYVAYGIVNQAGQYQLAAAHYAGSDFDSPTCYSGCEINQNGVFLESQGRGEDDIECSFYICSSLTGTGYKRGIWFRDTSIQSSSFSLKSLVDRIAALETQITELQSQLSAKANTNSPTFTGKVTINSITE